MSHCSRYSCFEERCNLFVAVIESYVVVCWRAMTNTFFVLRNEIVVLMIEKGVIFAEIIKCVCGFLLESCDENILCSVWTPDL